MNRLIVAALGALAFAACSHAKPLPEPGVEKKEEAKPPEPTPPPAGPSGEVARAAEPKEEPRSVPVPTDEPRAAVYFAFDSASLTDEGREVLGALGKELLQDAGLRVRIEGNCDERGTSEYNLALGQRRAEAARHYLVRLGVAAERIDAISFGKEKPKMPGHDEESWRINRRDDLFVAPQIAVSAR